MDTSTFLQNHVLKLVKNMKGKYSKLALERVEALETLTQKDVRKIILDTHNDMYREIEQTLLDSSK